MEHLKAIIEQYSRWQPLGEYIKRIEGYSKDDFSLCVENSKSLLESIAKEICILKNTTYSDNDNPSKLLKLAFASLGYSENDTFRQIGQSIANIGQQMGKLRNEIGKTSHGKPLEKLNEYIETVDTFTSDFLLQSVELVAVFLIQLFETGSPLRPANETVLGYNDNTNFNDFWDDLYGDFNMDVYTYSASEILYNLDLNAYETELNSFKLLPVEDEK